MDLSDVFLFIEEFKPEEVTKFKNKFLNPQFSVAQEFFGNLVTISAGGAVKYVIDGWYASASGAKWTPPVSVPPFRIICTTSS